MVKRNFVVLVIIGFFGMLIILESCEKDDGIIDSGELHLTTPMNVKGFWGRCQNSVVQMQLKYHNKKWNPSNFSIG